MKKTIISIILIVSCTVSLFLHQHYHDALCMNEDEASHGYNTYSVLQTGRDEYGKLPVRYLAFGENKLPLAGMLGSPFIALFGLHTWTVRMPTLIIGTLFPLLIFAAMYSLSRNLFTSTVAALFGATNIWLQVLSRHLHEAVILAGFVLLYIAVLFWKRPLPKKHMIILSVLTLLGLFSYHSAKIIMPTLAVFSILYYYHHLQGDMMGRLKKSLLFFVIILVAFGIFIATEYKVPNNRVSTLSYFTNPVFVHEIEEGRRLGGSRIFYNRGVYGVYQLVKRSSVYLSPHFLLFQSDGNPRFGAPYLPLLTGVEYMLFVIGIIGVSVGFILKRTTSEHVFILLLLVVSVLPASLTLLEGSSTRSYLLCVPILMLGAIGVQYIRDVCLRLFRSFFLTYIILIIIFIIQAIVVMNHWSIYFEKYLSDARTKGAWQCGMQEVAEYAWQNYDDYERIAISSHMGQPYIYMLFYGGPYNPSEYQSIAKTMPYNEYGFWEQESLDKYRFTKDLSCIKESKDLLLALKKSEFSKSMSTDMVLTHQGKHSVFYSFYCK